MRRQLALILASLTWPVAALSADFTSRGAGAMSCASWTKEHSDRTSVAAGQDQWVLGFVTAEEFLSETTRYKSPDNAALISWVTKYCSKSPLDPLANAAYSLTLQLRNDPADLERIAAGLRKELEQQCSNGDTDACKFIEHTQ